VAVHPDDPRYADLVGRTVILPLLGRHIPIVADLAVEPEFGTGAVKVTPAHDPADFAIGQRHNLPQVQVIGFDARMTAEAGAYAGLDRYEARRRVMEDLKAQGLIDHVEDYEISLGLCQRCETVIEPLVSTQWFVRMKPLAGPAAAAVRYGQLTIIPERFARVYLHWMDNIQDWCISRQLWWGHRIPAWYCGDCGIITVSREDPISCAGCHSARLERDPDVLDTWFSSWLWPFSTLGWPDDTEDLRMYYPTSVLETGYDILFFWVARMVFAGQHFTGVLPFHTVYLHGLVRDKHGEKMSKTKGNVIDPRELLKQYGTDALRFTLATGGTPGNDVKLDPRRVEDGRNFVTKVWNAARFALAQGLDAAPAALPDLVSLPDRWLASRLSRVVADVTRLIAGYQFGEAGRQAHDFFWSEFCDWYLEFAKIQLQGDSRTQETTRALLLRGLDVSLRLLHPFMPFVTEQIWQSLPDRREPLIVSRWPDPGQRDDAAELQMAMIFDVIRFVRNARAELGLDPARRLHLLAVSSEYADLLREQAAVIGVLARVDLSVQESQTQPPMQALHHALPGVELYLPLENIVDLAAERERLRQELARIEGGLASLRARLGNAQFVERAPAAVVEKERGRLADQQALAQTISERLRALEG
jgi:valyl-tRNA synthetase